jgi:hypothetical protein
MVQNTSVINLDLFFIQVFSLQNNHGESLLTYSSHPLMLWNLFIVADAGVI